MKKQTILILAAVAVVAGGWLLFRPEKLLVNQSVNESLPGSSAGATSAPSTAAQTLLAGHFHGVAHETRGTATVIRLADGKRIVRLSDFETSNGPEVHIYLGQASDAADSETVKTAGFINIAELKGNQGDQNYELPTDLDLAKYHSVTIWCQRFGVNFGTAPLRVDESASAAPVVLVAGQFHGVAHDGKGRATVYTLADGRRVLRLTEFSTSNGPELQLYLVAAADTRDSAAVKSAGFVTLGALKGNQGDQNYDVPADLDFSKYQSVTVWCHRFGVNFATAPLVKQ